MNLRISKYFLSLFIGFHFAVSCNSDVPEVIPIVQSVEIDSTEIISEPLILKKKIVYLSLIFTKSEYGSLPSHDVDDYKKHHNKEILIINDTLYFNDSFSSVISLEERERDSVLMNFKGPMTQDVYEIMDRTLTNKKIWELVLDHYHIPFHAIYFDSLRCFSYPNNIISTGKVLKLEIE